ncbi:hypothetical protein [Parendozoicomonas sp. Alg238-R29]|uniref:hypothetical protein n=1 Tax=Parendozoicomonas sp. Alg238-R29 TaxID=2993446 RepID=UPI0032B1A328
MGNYGITEYLQQHDRRSAFATEHQFYPKMLWRCGEVCHGHPGISSAIVVRFVTLFRRRVKKIEERIPALSGH